MTDNIHTRTTADNNIEVVTSVTVTPDEAFALAYDLLGLAHKLGRKVADDVLDEDKGY